MKKWPKEWIKAVGLKRIVVDSVDDYRTIDRIGTDYAPLILDALREVGALKEVPKPREGYVAVDEYGRWVKCTANKPGYGWADDAKDRVIKVREVEDE